MEKPQWRDWLVVGLLLATTAYVVAEEISLTTYYPSPKGAYQTLSSTASSRFAIYEGNVGIGTTSPAATTKLEVKGAGNTSGSAGLHVTNSDGTSGLFVRDDGHVGIGTASPAHPLTLSTVGKGLNAYLTIDADAGVQSAVNFQKAGAQKAVVYVPASSNDLRINDGSNDIVTFQHGGNVGIGTPSPGTKLEVAGQIKITGGTPGAGKVLTSDASGLATWESAGLASVQTFTSNGAWAKPAGVTKVRVEAIGGGGGGGGGYAGCGAGGGYGGGGGGGGYAEGFIDMSAISSVPVTVGNGGNGGAPCTAGGNGATSAFGSYVSASGGSGGQFGVGVGSGGFGSGGIFNSKGGEGKVGVVYGAGGYGGQAAAKGSGGGNGGASSCSSTTPGETPPGNGGGGGGGGSWNADPDCHAPGRSGGNGASGIVVVWEYK